MTTSDWFNDDEIWRIFGDCMFTEERFRAAQEEVDQIIDLVDSPGSTAPHKVMDLACGPGRHAVPLAARGLQVTAVDVSAQLLEMARNRAETAGVEIEFLRQDMRTVERRGQFDLIVNLWSSFGYFDDLRDDELVLQQCYRNLTNGGALVIDVVGKEYVLRNIQPVHLTEYDDGRILVERPVLENQMTRYSNQWILIDHGQSHVAEWHHNLYSGLELSDRLTAAGFGVVKIFGDLSGSDYDIESERLVAVAWKTNEGDSTDDQAPVAAG